MFTKTLIATMVAATLMPSFADAEVAYTDFGQRYVQPTSPDPSSCGANVRVYVIGDNNTVNIKVVCKETVSHTASSQTANSVKTIARNAVYEFYRYHSVDDGEGKYDIKALYGDYINTSNGTLSRDQLVEKMNSYNYKYDFIRFFVDEQKLDLSDCLSFDDCIVRGTITTVWKTYTAGILKQSSADFTLVFDLTNKARVTAECSVTESARNRSRGCSDFSR